jgi:hypothetical protein
MHQNKKKQAIFLRDDKQFPSESLKLFSSNLEKQIQWWEKVGKTGIPQFLQFFCHHRSKGPDTNH